MSAAKLVCGCDVGSLTAKAVVMRGRRVLGSAILRARAEPARSARTVVDQALAAARVSQDEIACVVGTGYGRDQIPFADRTVSEIACHARGARHLCPTARTVIDIGGQDCKAMRLEADGTVRRFVTNDKCASGTGRFLEVMAGVLGVSLEQLGELSRRARGTVTLANACTVWAQADVIKHVADGVPAEDLAAGINAAMAKRMVTLLESIGRVPDICMTGGVAKNAGVVAAIEQQAGIRLKRLRRFDPQLAGAIGAACFAAEEVSA